MTKKELNNIKVLLDTWFWEYFTGSPLEQWEADGEHNYDRTSDEASNDTCSELHIGKKYLSYRIRIGLDKKKIKKYFKELDKLAKK